MNDLHEGCGVIVPTPCRTYRCSFSSDDECVFCGFTLEAHKVHKKDLVIIRGPKVKRRFSPLRVKRAIGRNALCPCGSGKKYKNCCLK